MKFFIATKNAGKIKEFERIFKKSGLEFLSENDFDNAFSEPDETGTTFTQNAIIKARAGVEYSGLPTVADDSGLCVDALGGKPGIMSARYAGEHGDSKANNEKLLNELKGVSEQNRTAHFICVIACVFPDGREFTVTGKCDGKIDFAESGNSGFGYDPLFISSVGKFSEISAETKDTVSHRAKALKEFSQRLHYYL